MGFRTVVLLDNDRQDQWVNDPQLGSKIAEATHRREDRRILDNHLLPGTGYGSVLECAHADTNTLGIIESHNFIQLTYTQWSPGLSEKEMKLTLLRQFARDMGYRLVKTGSRK